MDPTRYTTDELAGLLRAQGAGYYPTMAAAELLIEHGTWLLNPVFVEHFVDVDDDSSMAWVRWRDAIADLDSDPPAGRLTGGGTPARMLRIAASLAANTPVNLQEAVVSLDAANIALVARAILGSNDAGRRGHVLVPPTPMFPPGIRVVAPNGTVLQDPDAPAAAPAPLIRPTVGDVIATLYAYCRHLVDRGDIADPLGLPMQVGIGDRNTGPGRYYEARPVITITAETLHWDDGRTGDGQIRGLVLVGDDEPKGAADVTAGS